MSNLSRVLWSLGAGSLFLLSGVVASASESGESLIKRHGCASCHDLVGSAETQAAGLWRKGPALYYAGNKYRQQWVEAWLQNPKQVRPTGEFYLDHVKSAPVRNAVRKGSFRPHVKLDAEEAKAIALTLAGMDSRNALVKAESYDAKKVPDPAGDILFSKVYGCMSCHRVEPNYGGLSGPEMYTAGARLKPEFMMSYIRNPQRWNPRSWMPKKNIPSENMQKLVGFIVDLSKENFDEE
ncbi:MAG: c-type cytochrome [Mariprofundales bacterium]